jgi:hypothetical protein
MKQNREILHFVRPDYFGTDFVQDDSKSAPIRAALKNSATAEPIA